MWQISSSLHATQSSPISASAYGESEFADSDLHEPAEFQIDYMDREYKRGRMAFLFGQYMVAHKIWQPLADKGHAKSQATMGWIFQTGKGAEIDMRKAFYWYQQAAQQKHKIAQNNLGVLYEQGLGVRKDYKEAAKWYLESAEWGYSYAQYNLGVLYNEGKGVKKNTKEAQYWLQIAALQGVEQARTILKDMLKESHGNNTQVTTQTSTPSAQSDKPQWQRQDLHANMGTMLQNARNQKQTAEGTTGTTVNTTKTSDKTQSAGKPVSTHPKPDIKVSKPLTNSSAASVNNRVDKSATGSNNTLAPEIQQEKPINESSRDKWLNNPDMDTWFLNAQVAQQHLGSQPVKKRTNSHSLRVFNNDWVKNQNPKNFTLQLARSDNLDWLLDMAKSQPMVLDTAFYTAIQDGKTYHFLIYGNFTSVKQANMELENLPVEVKKWKPWVRRYSDVHKRIKRWEDIELEKSKTLKKQ